MIRVEAGCFATKLLPHVLLSCVPREGFEPSTTRLRKPVLYPLSYQGLTISACAEIGVKF